MTDSHTGIEEATSAFEAAMGGNKQVPSDTNDEGPIERVFNDIEDEGNDVSEPAGGDEDEDERQSEIDLEGDDADEGEGDPSDDSEGDPEDEDEGEGDDKSDDILDQEVQITVDGVEETVTLREATQGYIRQKTFFQRLNKVDEYANVVTAEAKKVVAMRDDYVSRIEDLQAQIDSLTPAEPDWDKLYREDPAGAREVQKRFDSIKQAREQLDKEKRRVQEEQIAERAREERNFANTEFTKFVAAQDKSVNTREDIDREIQSMRKTGLALGFTEQELQEVYDSRMLLVLQKASKYDRLMARRPKPTRQGKNVVKPGAGSTRTAPKGEARAVERLRRTGSVDDAANVFRGIINRK